MKGPGLLDEILAAKRREVRELSSKPLPAAPPARPFALARGPDEPLRLIAEIKRRSPSAGELSRALDVGQRARAYEAAGANAVSVLCDAGRFGGAYEHLTEARAACALPLLCKEFVIDEVQLDAARAHGADAVLIIVRCLSERRLAELVSASRDRGLEPLVEVTDERESAAALAAGARIVGVNARDLDTLAMDTGRAARVLGALPGSITAVHLSGLGDADAIGRVRDTRADAALVGEALMRQDDPLPLLSAMVAAARPR